MEVLLPMTAYEKGQLKEIEEYKNMEPGVLQKVAGVLFKPFSWIAQKVIPEKALEGALKCANAAAKAFTDEDDILRDSGVGRIEELRHKDLELSDRLADEVHNWAVGAAAVEGGAAGAGGLAGMAVDIPALITMGFREIHKIGLCYGYKCDSEQMQMMVFQIFSVAGANTMKEKYVALGMLKRMQVILIKETWKQIVKKAAGKNIGEYGFLVVIRQLAKQLGINLSKRKALQVVPIIGAAVGAGMNASFLSDIGWAARRTFQEMWLKENKKIKLGDKGDIEDAEEVFDF